MDTVTRSASVMEYIASRQSFAVELLRRLVECESPSTEPATQVAMRELICSEFERLGMRCRRIQGRNSGGMMLATPHKRIRGEPVQLMLGHYDTVWPVGTIEEMPFKIEGDVISGPGVYDMKGGIVQAILALEAFALYRRDDSVTPLLFVNSDEEIGSRDSRHAIERLACCVDRVLVLEPSLGSAGYLKTTRKGIGRFTVTVTGKAAHAGLDPGGGASAILELSHVIQSLFALNDPDKGITVNVGTIDGGLRPNVVAPVSRAVADVRVATHDDANRIHEAILELRSVTPGTELEVEGAFGRPPLEQTPANRALWLRARELGTELGLQLDQALAGGGSDGNTTSLYTATLDGLGPVGDGAHAPHEHLQLGPTLQRAALLALILMEPPLRVDTLRGVGET
jgi:glutamate carboxypeptidase